MNQEEMEGSTPNSNETDAELCSHNGSVDVQVSIDEKDFGRSRKSKRPTKKFKLQNSYLTDAYEILDIRGVRHFCYALLPIWVARLLITDYFNKKPFVFPGIILIEAFRGFHYLLMAYAIFLLSSLVVFQGFRMWHKIRTKLQKSRRQIFDYTCLMFLISYMSAQLILPRWLLILSNLGHLTKGFIVGEHIRIILKEISFLVTKIPDVRDRTTSADAPMNETDIINEDHRTTNLCPHTTKFIYFIYAPTLIYSDDYPRTEKIRWRFALGHLAETLLTLYTGTIIIENSLLPDCLEYLSRRIPVTFSTYIMLIIQNMGTCIALFFLGNIGMFHSLQNFFAEIMRFGDRRFYGDWWNVTSPSGVYRYQNILVQDWLYFYVYVPMRNLTKSRLLSKICVMLLSGIEHECITGIAAGFVFPMNFVNFALVGGAFTYLGDPIGKGAFRNYLLLLTLPFGCSVAGSSLAVEYLARQHCETFIDSNWDYFVPRVFNCTLKDGFK